MKTRSVFASNDIPCCLGKNSQNNSECYNKTLWAIIPKQTFTGRVQSKMDNAVKSSRCILYSASASFCMDYSKAEKPAHLALHPSNTPYKKMQMRNGPQSYYEGSGYVQKSSAAIRG